MSKLYTERDIIEQGDYYSRHTSAMTGEGLDRKSDIAAELAHRDIQINQLQSQVAELYDLIKYAQVDSGVCMCGDNMQDHNQASGHSPVDVWDHAVEQVDKSGISEAFILRKQAEAVQASRETVSVPEWTDINLMQPEEYQDVLWFCQGGSIRTGMYYGKNHCDRVPETHPISRRGRSHYGKFGRYADPAESGHVVTHWMPLPCPPKQEQSNGRNH